MRDDLAFSRDHISAANDLIDAIDEYCAENGLPRLDGEPEMTAVMLVAFAAGHRCPGVDTSVESLARRVGEAATATFVIGHRKRPKEN